jgi:hypothetical protein
VTPAERLRARGWTADKFDVGSMYPPPAWGKTWSMPIEAAENMQRARDAQSLNSFGSVQYVPTDEQATTSPLCAALAARGVTERDAIEALNRQVTILIDQMVKTTLAQPPAPIHISADDGATLLGAALTQEQAISKAWQGRAKAERALRQARNDGDGHAAFQAGRGLASTAAALRALGVDPEAP